MELVSHSVSDSPAVTVLVTIYNREEYLAECVDSVLASTWPDMEVLLVDDRSSDGSLAVAQSFAARDNRVRVFTNESNLGDYPNRMRAARLARGRYLKYVDSDDVIYRHSLRIMVEAMESHPAAALALSHSLPEDERPYPWLLQPAEAWRKEFLGDGCLACGPGGAIIRRDAFLECGGFRDWGVLSDTDMWYRMSARWPIVLLQPGLVWWRRHDRQEYSREGAATEYLERGFALVTESLSSAECPLGEADRADAVARARQHHARRLISLALRRGQPRVALQLMRSSGLASFEMLQGLAAYR